jgi:predicted ArsR family transcriptional regulator
MAVTADPVTAVVLRELQGAYRQFQAWRGRSQLASRLRVPPAEVDRALRVLVAEGLVERALLESGGKLAEVWRAVGVIHVPVAAE